VTFKIHLILVTFLICPFYSLANEIPGAQLTTIRYFQTDQRYHYRIELLKLALTKTQGQWGEFQLIPDERRLTQGRGSVLLEKNQGIDIASFPTTYEREKRFIPIRMPILQGMLGCRVLLINQYKQEDFSKIHSLESLQKEYTAGFGNQWADMKILESNQLPVEGVTQYERLFEMLHKNRFDYFPRGINEAWLEIEKYQGQFKYLAVETSMALYYPIYVYYFVPHNKPTLAARVKQGLKIALQDGSFKALFKKHHQALIVKASLGNRKIFLLDNPFLPPIEESPKILWWLPNNLPTF